MRGAPRLLTVLLAFASTPIVTPPLVAQQDVIPLQIVEEQQLARFVGQVTNPTATTSIQYGYFTWLAGLPSPFAGAPTEANAVFTFFRDATTEHVAVDGPLRVITRSGTTTIYRNATPAGSFASPDSFRAGTPILVSTFWQQVVFDTVSLVFTVVNDETVTESLVFEHEGLDYVLGKPGDMYRTTKQGRLNSPAPPAGYFGGYSVGIGRGSARRSH